MIVKALLKHGASPNIKTFISEDTPFHYAARLCRVDLIKILLVYGADVKLASKNSQTPLDLIMELKGETAQLAQIVMLSAIELKEWLDNCGLSDYFTEFVREDVFLEDLNTMKLEAIENFTANRLGMPADIQKRLMSSLPDLKEKFISKQFIAKLSQAQKTVTILANTSNKDVTELKATLFKQVGSEAEWLISARDIEFTKELASGASGKVFKGLFKGVVVAIKVLKVVNNDFKQEFNVMSVLRDENLIAFLGACLQPRVCMVMEYCKKGSLYHVLKSETETLNWSKGNFTSTLF